MQTTNNFLERCKGWALVISATGFLFLGLAAFVFSISPAQADVNPQQTYATGKYQMEFTSVVSGGTTEWYILVYDTETGYSKMYYGDSSMGKITNAASAFNLPSSPL